MNKTRLISSAGIAALAACTLFADTLSVTAAPAAPAPKAQPAGKDAESPAGLAGALLAARHAGAAADTAAATSFYARALEMDPGNASLLMRSYSVAATTGRMDAAIAAAKRYYETEEKPLPLAGLLLAMGHFQKKEYDQAWTYTDRVTSDSYLAFAMPMIRAWTQAARGTPDAALKELAPLQSTQGLGDVFHMMSGMLNEYLGRNEDALIHYDALAQRIERQPLSVVRMIAAGYHRLGRGNDVKTLVAKYNNGRSTAGLYDMLDSLADPERVHKKVTLNDGLAEAYFATSQLLMQNAGNNAIGDIAQAFGQMALYLAPDMTIVRWVLGSTLAVRGRFDESTAMFNAIKKTEPAYLGAQIQIVHNLEMIGQSKEALAKLQALARDYPDFGEIPLVMGNLLRREEKFAEAVAAYDRAIAIYEKEKEIDWGLYFGRGVALERTHQWTRAEADFRKALQLNPDQPDVLNYLGYSWLDRGENRGEARRLIELAYSKAPDNGFIVDSMGWAMYLDGDLQGAVAMMEKAVELQPADPTLNDHLGDVYWKVGRRNEARFQWQRALTLKPEDKQRVAIQAKIEQGLASNEALPRRTP